MDLAIIGAGESSRIKAEGLKSPKHMIKINGEYLIERIIRIARSIETQKVFCIINSHEPELKNYLLMNDFGLPVDIIIQDTQSSMHSLFALAPYLMEDTILKFSDSKEGYNWATGGIYYFSPIIFKEMSYALENGIFRLRNFLRLLVARGHILKGFSFSKIIDVDHVTDIPKAEELIKSEKK